MTMARVAAQAGVSTMTVSYTFNQPERVAAETARRVREVAARLGYAGPDPTAQSLRRRRRGALGVVLGEPLTYAFDDPQATRFLAGVAAVCTERTLGLVLVPIRGDDHDADRVHEAAVDGFVVWTTTMDAPALDGVLATGLPTAIQGGPAREGATLVTVDDRAAARAVGLEAFRGRRRPAVLSLPLDAQRRPTIELGPDPRRATFPVTRARLLGFRDACEDLGIAWPSVTVAVCARNDGDEAEVAARALLVADHSPDAMAAMSDQQALGALRAARAIGASVPAALAVSGWDDTAAAAPAGLTTVRQDLRDQGERCARAVLDGPAADPAAGTVAWELVTRASTA